MKNKSASHATPSFIKAFLLGIAVITAAFAVFSFCITLIVYNTENPTAKTELFSIIAFVLAAATGAFINTRLFGKEKTALPYLSSVAALALFLIISLIAAGALSGGHLMSALCFAVVTVLAAFLAKSRKSARRTRRKRT